MSRKSERVKGLFMGDNFVGKRALARRCAGGSPPSPQDRYWIVEDTPVVDVFIRKNYSKSKINKEHSRTREEDQEEPIKVEIALWMLRPYYDDEAPRLRDLILENVEVAAICYSINDRESLENAIHKVCVPYTVILWIY